MGKTVAEFEFCESGGVLLDGPADWMVDDSPTSNQGSETSDMWPFKPGPMTFPCQSS